MPFWSHRDTIAVVRIPPYPDGHQMATTWSDRKKAAGVRLELTWFAARNCWKKKHKEIVYYFKHSNSKSGYEAAWSEWLRKRDELDGTRKNALVYQQHKELFERVLSWYDAFGVPITEQAIHDQVQAFLSWLDELYQQPDLTDSLPMGAFCRPNKRAEFYHEFTGIRSSELDSWMVPSSGGYTLLGRTGYDLPPKWLDRLDRMSSVANSKEPQTIGHWLDKYIQRVSARGGKFITPNSARDRAFKLAHFRGYTDLLAHVSVIDEVYLERYHAALDSAISEKSEVELSRDSKIDYFGAFRMFVRWCSQQRACELPPPANLDSKEFSFREPLGTGRKRQQKKAMLWTVAEFTHAIAVLPKPYPAYLMLMLNCGFRHVDLSQLRWVDLQLDQQRLVIQRNKLNQQETAPVVSYPLWDKTVELLKDAASADPVYVLRNQDGGSVENSIKVWWKRNAHKHELGHKRLDFIRKTGATMIARIDSSLDDMYLGETLSTTAKVHYSFHDGEPCRGFDDSVRQMGSEFGFSEAPLKTVTLTQEVLAKLAAAGIDVASLSSRSTAVTH